jgi:predicted molibdopterin-dependent oxidoreductase YjgC
MCVVEIKGVNGLVSACSTKATGGMEIFTHSESVLKSRRVLMEFIIAENRDLTQDKDVGDENTRVRQLSAEIGISSARFMLPIETKLQLRRQLSEHLSIDPSRCIHCDRCILACDAQQVIKRSGFGSNIVNSFGDSDLGIEASNCSYCGDCVAVCPVGGIKKA